MRVAVPVQVQEQLAGPPAPAGFTEAELDGIPGPVRRYLRAAIAPPIQRRRPGQTGNRTAAGVALPLGDAR